MDREYIGTGKKKVLVVHGWMHSSKRYVRLAEDLSKSCTCTLLNLPGFGGSKPIAKWDIVEAYVEQLVKILEEEHYDLIIGHSLGGALILRALERVRISNSVKVLLANPSYYGIDHLRLVAAFIPINTILFKIQTICPRYLVSPFIKTISLLSVNKWALIDDRVIDDSRNAHPWTAAVLMYELVFDKWRTKNTHNIKNITIVKSKKDRVILASKIHKLQKDLRASKLIELPDVGHTTVLESYDELLEIIREELVEWYQAIG